jgi:hypothetical protein
MGLKPAIEKGYRIVLEPGETRGYELEFGILVGRSAIEEFAAILPA